MPDSETIEKNYEEFGDAVIVFSAKKHVDYIENILWQIEKSLKSSGYNPVRLDTSIRSGQDRLKKIVSLSEEAVLGVIVLDGLRPNVVLEMGMLIALRKRIIVCKCGEAEISVKTLYSDVENRNFTPEYQKQLKNPTLDIKRHLSDFAGKHIINLSKNTPRANRTIIETELEKVNEDW